MYFQVDTEEIGNIVKHISSYDILKLESAPAYPGRPIYEALPGDGGEK